MPEPKGESKANHDGALSLFALLRLQVNKHWPWFYGTTILLCTLIGCVYGYCCGRMVLGAIIGGVVGMMGADFVFLFTMPSKKT
jgi:hypothetical protein